jgi:hypothetical protein
MSRTYGGLHPVPDPWFNGALLEGRWNLGTHLYLKRAKKINFSRAGTDMVETSTKQLL